MKLKAGVLGAGHLGKIHLKLLQQSEKYELTGFYDPDESNGKKVEHEYGYPYFSSLESLIDAVDVVDIVTPTLSHYTVAKLVDYLWVGPYASNAFSQPSHDQ